MVNFIETFHLCRILVMKTSWLIDDLDNLYLMNVSELQHMFYERKYLTTEGYVKKLQEKAELKLQLPEQLEQKFQDRKDSEVIKKFADVMMEDYERHKKQLGIENTKKKTNDDEISDEIFAKIHPTFKFKLSDLLKGNNNIQQIK